MAPPAEGHEGVEEPAPVDERWVPADTEDAGPGEVEAQDADDDDTGEAGPAGGQDADLAPAEQDVVATADGNRPGPAEAYEGFEEPAPRDDAVLPVADEGWAAEDEDVAPGGDEDVAAAEAETPFTVEEHDESASELPGDDEQRAPQEMDGPALDLPESTEDSTGVEGHEEADHPGEALPSESSDSADAGHDVPPELERGPETEPEGDAGREAEADAGPQQDDPVATDPDAAAEPATEAAVGSVSPAPPRPTTGGDVPVDPPAVIRPGAPAATERRLADVPVAKATPRVASNPYGIPGADAPVTPPVVQAAPAKRGAAPAAAGAPESPAAQAEYMEAIIPPLDEASWREDGAVAAPRRRPRPQPLTAEEKAAEDLAGPSAEDEAPRSRAEAREATRQETQGMRRIRRRLLLFIVAVVVVVVVVAVTASWMKANGVPLVAPAAPAGWVTAMPGPPLGSPAL